MVQQHKQLAADQKSRSLIDRFRSAFQRSLICGIFLLAGCTNPSQQIGVSPTPTDSPLPSPTISPSPLSTPLSPTPGVTPGPSPTESPSPTTEKPTEVVTIENQVKDLVTESGSLTVQAVSCPANISEQPGNSYDCQVQSNVGAFVVVVQPTGQPGKFRWGTRGLLLVSKLTPLIQRNFESSGGGKVSVDCGAIARTAKAGETFDCKVVDAAGTSRIARVTVRDDQGNVYVTPL